MSVGAPVILAALKGLVAQCAHITPFTGKDKSALSLSLVAAYRQALSTAEDVIAEAEA